MESREESYPKTRQSLIGKVKDKALSFAENISRPIRPENEFFYAAPKSLSPNGRNLWAESTGQTASLFRGGLNNIAIRKIIPDTYISCQRLAGHNFIRKLTEAKIKDHSKGTFYSETARNRDAIELNNPDNEANMRYEKHLKELFPDTQDKENAEALSKKIAGLFFDKAYQGLNGHYEESLLIGYLEQFDELIKTSPNWLQQQIYRAPDPEPAAK